MYNIVKKVTYLKIFKIYRFEIWNAGPSRIISEKRAWLKRSKPEEDDWFDSCQFSIYKRITLGSHGNLKLAHSHSLGSKWRSNSRRWNTIWTWSFYDSELSVSFVSSHTLGWQLPKQKVSIFSKQPLNFWVITHCCMSIMIYNTQSFSGLNTTITWH